MATLSAADLQRRHELEGAPDPFPSLADTPVKSRTKANGAQQPDVDSPSAFPSLAPAAPAARPAGAAWGAAAGPRLKSTVAAHPMVAESFTVTSVDLSSAGKDGKPGTLGEVMKQVMAKTKVKLEASTNQKTRQTTFALKAESTKELEKAKRSLLALLSPIVTVVIDAPASTIATIIGPKGSTLKHIRDVTNVKVDIPRRDALSPPSINGANGSRSPSGALSPVNGLDDDDEEPTIPVSVTGPQPSVLEAQEMLKKIIASKTSKTTQRVRDIPVHVLPFIKARRLAFEAAAQGGEINLGLNSAAREVTVIGDREAVIRVVEAIKSAIGSITDGLTSLKISLPKRQHRLLTGKAIDEIIVQSKCSVVVAGPDDAGDEVVVWGKGEDLPAGLQAVMQKANSQYIHEYSLPGPIATSKQFLTYMARVGFPKTVSAAHPGVTVYTPSPAVLEKATTVNLELVGDKAAVDAALAPISELIGKLFGGTRDVPIDWLVHRILQGTKNAKKLKQFHDAHNVRVFFPVETAEQSSVLLVYDPTSPSASPNPVEKKKQLDEVEKELLKLSRDAADVKSESVTVEQKWHDAVVGRGGTTLNAIIGEDKTLSIKVGKEAGVDTEDVIVVRGPRADVDRAVKEIAKIVEDAKNDEIDNSHHTEFDIDREYVGRIVGSGGAGVNKIRDQLGVKVDFSDDADDKEKDGKRRKGVHQKSHVTIVGRKENVEEAKKRILAQVDRLADETSEVLKIPTQYHASLIGQSGKYATRLEEKYSVKITFPRSAAENGEGRTREVLKTDEVLVKGGRKGVAQAKAELLDALEFEKESNNVIKFTVPTRSVARILGRGGATINEIKDNTGAQIDIDKASEESGGLTNISLRGSKKDIAAAKAAILEISAQVGEETTDTVLVDNRFHRTIIGAGGQGLRDLVVRCGGPSDPKHQAGLIRFPRQGDPSDEVRLRGEPKVVAKLKTELENLVATMRDRTVLAVDVPASQHRALIGRGGQHLNELQSRTGAQVQFPGSRSYHQVGEAVNADELKDVDPANIVKVSGSKAACEKAIEELKASVKAVKPPAPELTATVSVPLKYHHFISQQGNFFRTLRTFGVQVENPVVPQRPAVPARPPPAGAASARIDEAEDAATGIEWQVIPNFQDVEEGDSEWTLKARDQAGLDKAQKRIEQAIESAGKMSHVGFLTMPDRTLFPRIVGAKGSNVARLREETGADITLSREDNVITIIGTEAAIEAAKEEILKVDANRPPRGGRRERD